MKIKRNRQAVVKQNRFLNGANGQSRTDDQLFTKQQHTIKLLNKIPVSTIALLSNLSKPYISQVKSGKRPPSQKLLDFLD
jgi:transcriptional regulator with XRE-family HTH domain